MGLSALTDGISRSVESVSASISGMFEPTLRLGVTGLSGAGKTVFITSLIANLLERGRMPQLSAQSQGRIETVLLQPQPDLTLPRFDYETHLTALLGDNPRWPESTRAVSELRLSFRLRPHGFFAGLTGPSTLHLDIVDYPGEWLLDLGLMEKSYAEWSALVLGRMATRDAGARYRKQIDGLDTSKPFDDLAAQELAAGFTDYLHTAREAGFSDLTPGRFILPGDLAGSPVLTFAPLPPVEGAKRGSLWHECARRYESYKRNVVLPFFRDHFAKIDRQIVLVDVLGALHAGPRAVEDLRLAMTDILAAFRPGRAAFLTRLLGGKRVDKILFAATKADHLHQTQHQQLTDLTSALLRQARDRADFAGAETQALSLAALRCTTEETRAHDGREVALVRGRLADGRNAAFWPGLLPTDPAHVLAPAREGAAAWLDGDFAAMQFQPAPLTLKPGDGPPHIRLDRAAQFLFGDRL